MCVCVCAEVTEATEATEATRNGFYVVAALTLACCDSNVLFVACVRVASS